METLLSSQKRVISYHFCTLASSPPSCPPYPPHPAQKTLALKAVEFPRVKSLKKFIDRLLKFQEVSQGVFFFTSKVFLLRFFASNVICTNLSVNNLRCFYEQSERSLIVHSRYTTQKNHIMLFRCDKFLLQKSFFSRAHLHFPSSFVLSGTKFAEACFTSEGHQEGQLRQPEHFNKITLLQRINGEMFFFLSFSLFFKAGLK